MLDQVWAVLTIIVSLLFVVLIIASSWWLMWKLFLSRFEFINEILFPEDEKSSSATSRKSATRRKQRKD